MLKRVFLIPLFLVGLITGCEKESTTNTSGVPNRSVSFTDNVDQLPNLLNTLVWAYVSGGCDGIVLYCQSPGNYLAFDIGCPYDCQTNTKAVIAVQAGNITAKCPVYGTTYSLFTGTISNKDTGTVALKQYQTSFDLTTMLLTVTN